MERLSPAGPFDAQEYQTFGVKARKSKGRAIIRSFWRRPEPSRSQSVILKKEPELECLPEITKGAKRRPFVFSDPPPFSFRRISLALRTGIDEW
jgi:hypothetical protein